MGKACNDVFYGWRLRVFCVVRTRMPVIASSRDDKEAVVSMLISCCLLGYSLVCEDFSNE
jgi:hypothetical protein